MSTSYFVLPPYLNGTTNQTLEQFKRKKLHPAVPKFKSNSVLEVSRVTHKKAFELSRG